MKKTYALVLLIVFLLAPQGLFAEDLPETEISENAFGDTTAIPKTYEYLTFLVNRLITDTKSTSSNNFCPVLDSTFTAQSEVDRGSFAWNRDSYTLPATAIDETAPSAHVYEESFHEWEALNLALDSIPPSDGAALLNREKAIYRSTLIEILNEYRDTDPDTERISELFAFLNAVSGCLHVELADATPATVQEIEARQQQVENIWITNRTMFTAGGLPEANTLPAIEITRRNLSTAATTPDGDDAVSKLVSFLEERMRANANIKGIAIKDGKVTLSYTIPAKLFGFIKTHTTMRITLDQGGVVSILQPWYRFAVRPVSSPDKNMISGSIASTASDIGNFEDQTWPEIAMLYIDRVTEVLASSSQ